MESCQIPYPDSYKNVISHRVSTTAASKLTFLKERVAITISIIITIFLNEYEIYDKNV